MPTAKWKLSKYLTKAPAYQLLDWFQTNHDSPEMEDKIQLCCTNIESVFCEVAETDITPHEIFSILTSFPPILITTPVKVERASLIGESLRLSRWRSLGGDCLGGDRLGERV